MALPVCLVHRHNHLTALAALDLVPEKPVFPAMMTCPLCSAPNLYLFDDIVTAGIWFHCETCRAHGDIITFAAQIWNTSPREALNRFADIGSASSSEVDRLSGEYIRAINRLKAGEEFWETAASQIWNHRDDIIACRLREFGVDESMNCGHGLLGVAHPDQISEFCRAIGRAAPVRMRDNGPSIILPFYDLPGRMTGVLSIQYNDQFMSRRVFLPLAGVRKFRTDAGYFLLHTALTPAPEVLRNSYFITDDLTWAINAQCANLRTGLPLLPLAVAYSGPEARSSGRTLVGFGAAPRFFHSAHITPDTVTQAANAKGYVCACPPLKAYRRPHPLLTLKRLAIIRKTAQTWQAALNETLKTTNEIAAQSFITKLGVDIDKLQAYLNCQARLPKELVGRLLARIEQSPALSVKVQRSWTAIARDGCWWSVAGVQIANAQVVIDKVVCGSDGARLYVGRVAIEGKTIPFTESAARVENMGLLAYAAQLAAEENMLLVYSKPWNRHSHMTAMRIQPPEIINVSSRNGWDEKTNEFGLYNYRLSDDGTVLPVQYPEINPHKTANFPEPGAVAPITIHTLLTPAYEHAQLWTVFAAIVADVLAPIMNKDARATAIPEQNFAAAAEIGAMLGCQLKKSNAARRATAARTMLASLDAPDWPVFAAHTFEAAMLAKTVLLLPTGPILVKLPPAVGLLAPSYGWQYAPGAMTATPQHLTTLQYVLPSYIQRALQTRLEFARRDTDLTRAVLQDLADWLKDIYGATFNLPYALNQLVTPADAHKALLTAVNLGLEDGKLDILPRPRSKDQSKAFLLRNRENWWLNQRAIDRYCIELSSFAPNWPAILELLERDNLLRGEDTVHGMPGVLVRKDWCDQFWSGPHASTKRELG